VHVTGAATGDRLVYDMNAAPGWRAAGAPAESWQGLVSVTLASADQVVEISYWPPRLTAGLGVFAATVILVSLRLRRDRRRRPS